ncbi:MAG TPA: helix-turn-helix transcriptional regulator [Candidatus Pacearchaeota archaeon]|jgi:transcriptional regulator with XRE-family HTH domain|nr:helix-turn-helix transcriptional regulator [Candidatus Pacearchaeota archaeon]
MKITNKKNIDPIAEARKNKHFKRYSGEADVKIRFAIAVYRARTKKRMSQQELAKKAQTTQKRISNIENADVDLGMSAIYRISQALCFDSKTLADIFGCDFIPYTMIFSETANSQISQINEPLTNKIY